MHSIYLSIILSNYKILYNILNMWSLNCLADHTCSFTNASLTPRGELTGYKFKLMNINKDIN
jgi:hypothetical protein